MCGTVHCRCECLHVLHKSTPPTRKHWSAQTPTTWVSLILDSVRNRTQSANPNNWKYDQRTCYTLSIDSGHWQVRHLLAISYKVWKQGERRVNHAWIFHEEQKFTINIKSVCTQEDYRYKTETCKNISEDHCALWIHNGPLYALNTQWAIVCSQYTMGHCTLSVHNGPLYALNTQWAEDVKHVGAISFSECKMDPKPL